MVNIIISIVPSIGSVFGGTVVSVNGNYLLESYELHCKFGSMTSVAATWISNNLIKCTTPASINFTVGIVEMYLTNNRLKFYSDYSKPFRYRRITFLDVTPKHGCNMEVLFMLKVKDFHNIVKLDVKLVIMQNLKVFGIIQHIIDVN